MTKWIKLTYMRGEIFVLKRINTLLGALLLSWHADWAIAILALFAGLVSLLFVVLAMWVFAGGVAHALRGNMSLAWTLMLYTFVCLALAKMISKFALWLLPLDKADMANDE